MGEEGSRLLLVGVDGDEARFGVSSGRQLCAVGGFSRSRGERRRLSRVRAFLHRLFSIYHQFSSLVQTNYNPIYPFLHLQRLCEDGGSSLKDRRASAFKERRKEDLRAFLCGAAEKLHMSKPGSPQALLQSPSQVLTSRSPSSTRVALRPFFRLSRFDSLRRDSND